MPYFELSGGPDNPYPAVIGTDIENYAWGDVRIEPPFIPGPNFNKYVIEDGIAPLIWLATDEKATLFHYGIMNRAGWAGGLEDKEIIGEIIADCLKELGRIASKEAFKSYYESLPGA